MYDKQKMILIYILIYMGVIAAKVAFQSAGINVSVMPHVVGTVVIMCALTLLVQQGRFRLNTRVIAGLIIIYAFDIYFAYIDNRFLLTPLVLIIILLVAGALLENSIVLAVLIGGNLLTVLCCIIWPELIFSTVGESQMLYMMVIADATGVLMYIMTRWASQLIAQGNEKAREADNASRAKTQFLASVSHEIRTPMNAIMGMNELILAASQSANIDELKQNAVYIKTAGLGLLELINDILDISKMEKGKMELVEGPYNAERLFQSLAHELQEKIGMRPLAKHVDMDFSIARDMVGDDVRIRQLVAHLLSNAVKFTSEGLIELVVKQRMATEGGVVLVISIRDTGCGMSAEGIENIRNALVDDYFKESTDSDGIGIGLTIVVRLLDMMKGTLDIDSEPGKGTTFVVQIPQRISTEAVAFAVPQMLPETPRISDAHILVVDDNSTNIQVCRGIFKRYTLNIDTALSGQEAVEKAAKNEYDIIFMDYMMPGMDGAQAMNAIRRHGGEHNAKVPVVVLTAGNSAEQERQLLEMGFDAYLCKPIDTLELTRILRTHLTGSPHIDDADKLAPQYALGLVLPGINVQKGIQRSGGTLALYLEALQAFIRTGTQRTRTFQAVSAQSDLTTVALEAHALKAVAERIGAERLASMSGALELQANVKSNENVIVGLGPLLSELQKLIETITAALHEEKPSLPVNSEPALLTEVLLERLETLCTAAEAYDLDAASAVLQELLTHQLSDKDITMLG